ncbi:MAG TPA: AI-2E family transporter, partial [Pirellulales bacterium]|nr:AI-2E family transporter [Pirellulales bacterium]
MNWTFFVRTLAVFGTLLGVFAFWLFREALMLFIISLVIAAALRPLTNFFIRKRSPPTAATIAAYFCLLGTIVLFVAALGGPLIRDLEHVGTDLMKTYNYVTDNWPQGNWIEKRIAQELPPADEIWNNLTGKHGAQTFQTVLGMTFSVAEVLIDLVIILILSVYWSMDRIRFERLWLSLLSAPRRVVARDTWHAVEHEVGSYFRSEYLQSMLAAVLLALGFWWLKHPYPALAGLIAGLAWTLPWVGVMAAGGAVAFLALPLYVFGDSILTATIATAGSVVLTFALLLLLELVIEPRLFARRRFNMVLVTAVSICLAYAFGLIGLLLGPPTAVVIQIIAGHLLR